MSVYKEFRRDGWPFCPRCEEDELYSFLMLGWTKDEPPSVQECIDSGMKCYRCSWDSTMNYDLLDGLRILSAVVEAKPELRQEPDLN